MPQTPQPATSGRRSTQMFCQKLRRTDASVYLANFYPNPRLCVFADSQEQVFEAIVEESEETPDCYWAYWDYKEQNFHFVYNYRSCVDVCFPGGVDAEKDRGRGECLPVRIIVGNAVPANNR